MAKSVEAKKPYVETEELVQPVESVESVAVTDPCWNCESQLTDNKCSDCGFDKTLLYNLNLEADKAANKQAQIK